MSLLLVNVISTTLALVSVAIFLIVGRRTAEVIRLGKTMAHQITDASKTLDQALLTLQNEHDDFRDENRKLDARMTESGRIRRDIDRSVELMQRIRSKLQGELHTDQRQEQRQPIAKTTNPPSAIPNVVPKQAVKLPVFVQRSVRLNQTNHLAGQS